MHIDITEKIKQKTPSKHLFSAEKVLCQIFRGCKNKYDIVPACRECIISTG